MTGRSQPDRTSLLRVFNKESDEVHGFADYLSRALAAPKAMRTKAPVGAPTPLYGLLRRLSIVSIAPEHNHAERSR